MRRHAQGANMGPRTVSPDSPNRPQRHTNVTGGTPYSLGHPITCATGRLCSRRHGLIQLASIRPPLRPSQFRQSAEVPSTASTCATRSSRHLPESKWAKSRPAAARRSRRSRCGRSVPQPRRREVGRHGHDAQWRQNHAPDGEEARSQHRPAASNRYSQAQKREFGQPDEGDEVTSGGRAARDRRQLGVSASKGRGEVVYWSSLPRRPGESLRESQRLRHKHERDNESAGGAATPRPPSLPEGIALEHVLHLHAIYPANDGCLTPGAGRVLMSLRECRRRNGAKAHRNEMRVAAIKRRHGRSKTGAG
jgi:hypothetical protein